MYGYQVSIIEKSSLVSFHEKDRATGVSWGECSCPRGRGALKGISACRGARRGVQGRGEVGGEWRGCDGGATCSVPFCRPPSRPHHSPHFPLRDCDLFLNAEDCVSLCVCICVAAQVNKRKYPDGHSKLLLLHSTHSTHSTHSMDVAQSAPHARALFRTTATTTTHHPRPVPCPHIPRHHGGIDLRPSPLLRATLNCAKLTATTHLVGSGML